MGIKRLNNEKNKECKKYISYLNNTFSNNNIY